MVISIAEIVNEAANTMNLFTELSRQSVQELLAQNNLPIVDLDDLDMSCFLGCGPRANPTGVTGLDIHQGTALLRSLMVAQCRRGTGCGHALVSAIEKFASNKGVSELYMLTETAEQFFLRQGYTVFERHFLPASIIETREFSALCPHSATVMAKSLPV